MSSKSTLFVANWKMNGTPSDLKEINKVADFLKKKFNKFLKIVIYCPPTPLLTYFSKKNLSNLIKFGAQNVSSTNIDYGAKTGSLSPKLLKQCGAEYVIIGHSERRLEGENFSKIKKKINTSLNSNLKIILCIGETFKQKKNNKSLAILKMQITKALSMHQNLSNVIFAYEPIWSIGTGVVADEAYLNKIFNFLNIFLKKKYKIRNPKILYGGSVNHSNIKNLRLINHCSGYLVGGASLKAKNFIEIIVNYYN